MNEGVDPQAIVVAVKRIFVPIDRSGYKEKIIAYAVSLGKAWGAEITAIYVIEPGHALSDGRDEAKEQAREEAGRQAEHLLNEIATLAKKEGRSTRIFFWKRCQQSHSPCTLSSICNPLIHRESTRHPLGKISFVRTKN
jgi:nucleotide-binding universal stress UspA family protein